jgi:putative serine protease PepD
MATATPPAASDRGRRPVRRGPRRSVLAVLAAAVAGAAVLAVILLATGAVQSGPTTAAAPSVTTGPVIGSLLHPTTLYTAAAPGVVDITARSARSTSTGTGIILDVQGRVLTADHVVRGASSVSVTLANGTTRSARVLGQDETTDLAVLSVNPSGLALHPLALGDSGALRVGDPVAAIGDPFDYRRSLSTGIVSGLDRTIQGLNGFSITHAVQTDAALDPGNSGGPLLDSAGHVIGVVDQIATGNSGADQSSGVGFAISSNVAKAELADLERGSTPTHAYLGIASAPAVGTSGTGGVVVQAVQPGGPAARTGLRAGDVIETIGGKSLRGVDDLISTVSAHRPGQTITLGIRRGSRQLTLRVALGTQPRNASAG